MHLSLSLGCLRVLIAAKKFDHEYTVAFIILHAAALHCVTNEEVPGDERSTSKSTSSRTESMISTSLFIFSWLNPGEAEELSTSWFNLDDAPRCEERKGLLVLVDDRNEDKGGAEEDEQLLAVCWLMMVALMNECCFFMSFEISFLL